MSFAFAGFASLGFLMRFAFLRSEVRRRFNTLFAQPLVLDLLLMFDQPFFLFALEINHLFGSQLLVLQQIFVYQQGSPCVRGGVARLLGRETGVLPIGELLRLGDLTSVSDCVVLLKSLIQDAVRGNDFLNVNAVGGREITSAAKAVDIIFERQTDFAHLRVREEIREFLRHADMGETEEVTTLVGRYLNKGSGIMYAALETGT